MKKHYISFLLTACLLLWRVEAQQTVPQEQISHLNNAEVPKGSKLRAQLFDIARPEIEQAAGCQVRFLGSMVRDGEAVDFKGKVINSKDQPIRFNGSELVGVRWKLSSNTWQVDELSIANSIQSKNTPNVNLSYNGVNAQKTDTIKNININTEKQKSTLEPEKGPSIKTILQERPDQIDSATINCNKNIIALNRNDIIYFYEISSERLIKKAELNGSQIRRIFFKKETNDLYYYRVSASGGIDVYLYNYSNNGISKVNHYEADEIIGYDENRDVFALMKEQGKGSDRAIDWITEVSPESGSVLSKKQFNPESDLLTQLSGSYDKNEKLSVVQISTEEDRPGVLIKLSEFSRQENRDFLKNDVLSRIVENLKLPNEVKKANRNDNQYNNYIYLNQLKLNIDESFKISRQRDLIISSGGGIRYAINKNGFWETHEIPTTEKRITGITASYSGKNIFAWSVLNASFVADPNGKLIPMYENGEVDTDLQLDISEKNSSSSFIYDFGSFQYKKNEFDTNDIISAAFSDDGLTLGFRTAEISKRVQSENFKMGDEKLETHPVVSYYGIFNLKHNQTTNLDSVPTYTFGSHAIGSYVDLSFLVNDGSIVFNKNFYKQYATKGQLIIDASNNVSITENEKSGFRTEIGYDLTKKRGYINKNYRNRTTSKIGAEIIWESSGADFDARSTKTLVQAFTDDGKNISSFYINAAIDSAYQLNKNKILISIPQNGISVIDTNGNKIIARYTNNIISEGNWTWVRMPNPQRLAITEDFLYYLENSGKIAIMRWDDSNNKFYSLPSLYPQSSGPPVFLDLDGYYSTASKSIIGVHFTDGLRTYPLEQFDLRLNRPDIVLDRLGAPKEAIEAAKSLRDKRLKRMGVTEEMLKPDFHLPELQIVGDVPSTTPQDRLDLQIKATDDKYPLDRLRVYVNNVPVNGRDGELLRDQKTQSLEKAVPIKLAAGRNKIQISVLNSAGAESLYANAEVNCTAERPKPKLYAVALGVSQYDRPEWCLKYAAKDATDLVGKLKEKAGTSYSEVKPLLLTDKDVTKESTAKIKEFISGATIDDTVLIFMAGHGILDDKYDYYFGTTDIDPAKPAERGMPYEAIDTILAEVPSLKKALLMDTCHAGELDEDEKKELATSDGSATPAAIPAAATNSSPMAGKVAMRSIGTRGMSVKAVQGAKGKSDWYEKLQDMFVDLRRGSGATVISSSQGAEYAFESSEQSNGLFTYALMEALDGKAAPNKEGQITISAIGDYVKKRVQDLTKGKQNPNLRGVNLEEDFTIGADK
jgi:uncharacterized caspase-like protein